MNQDSENSVNFLEVQDTLPDKKKSKNVSLEASGFAISIVEEPDDQISPNPAQEKKAENDPNAITAYRGAVFSITIAHGIVKHLSLHSPDLKPYDFI